MRILITFCFILFIAITLEGQNIKITKQAKITFVSKAPLELISASSNICYGALDLNNNEFLFRVNINSFEGFNSPMQKEHFNENYLESEDLPYATYSGSILEKIDFSSPGKWSVTTKGVLTIHGVEDERVIDLQIEIMENGEIQFQSKFDIELTAHKIEVPRIVYQKISEVIQINVNGTLN